MHDKIRIVTSVVWFALGAAITAGYEAKAQELVWAKQAVGPSPSLCCTQFQSGNAIATTERGDSYVSGGFDSTATFGKGEPNETMLTSEGRDLFVAKYDRAGALVWATQAGGADTDQASGISINARGDSYVTGRFEGTATFGKGEPNETMLTSEGGDDLFVAKYDRAGTLVWATQAGGGDTDQASGISTTELVDGEDNIYVTGRFEGTATFGKGEPNETMLTSEGGDDIFVAKYDGDGALVWATHAGGADTDQASGISTTERGDDFSHITGSFSGTATFGKGEPNQTMLTSEGSADLFVAKYDRDGALVWATQAGGADTDQASGIATTERGDSYVTGRFEGTATFGQGEPNETMLTSEGGDDLFVAKYDRAGTLVWATQAGGGDFGTVVGNAISTSARGDSYVTGGGVTGVGAYVIFVAKYDRDGALLWATQTGRGAGDTAAGLAIATTARGDSYVTGTFDVGPTFGQGEPNETALTCPPQHLRWHCIFVAKYR